MDNLRSYLKRRAKKLVRRKHVPVIEALNGKVKVSVGAVEHPMEGKHYIEWIEALAKDVVCKRFSKPSDKPVAIFDIRAGKVVAKSYCKLTRSLEKHLNLPSFCGKTFY